MLLEHWIALLLTAVNHARVHAPTLWLHTSVNFLIDMYRTACRDAHPVAIIMHRTTRELQCIVTEQLLTCNSYSTITDAAPLFRSVKV